MDVYAVYVDMQYVYIERVLLKGERSGISAMSHSCSERDRFPSVACA